MRVFRGPYYSAKEMVTTAKNGMAARSVLVSKGTVINALRCVVHSSWGWGMLPIHFGHWRTIYGQFPELSRRFLFQTIRDVVLKLDRERTGREASPSGPVIDS